MYSSLCGRTSWIVFKSASARQSATHFDTEIVSCEPVNDLQACKSLSIEEPKEPNKLYEIILKDTILFPEGGGQPDDRGVIGDVQVIRVIRKGTTAVHYAHLNDERLKSMKPEEVVSTKINWERRFDHMQQHSGQHLITAVTDQMYGFPTTSWWLGTEDSYIELDTKEITQEQVKAIEEEVNLKIRECRPVSVDVVELDDPKLKTARGRNLPEDVKGQIRIVTMAGVESNVCCGTHVTNLSQLQAIVLSDVIKKKGKCNLYFLAGNRVIDRFRRQFQREQKLMGILKASTEELPLAAEKLNIALKNSRKNCQVLSKDLSALEAQKLKQSIIDSSSPLVIYHRDNVDLDFSSSLIRELGSMKGKLLLITLKTEGNNGHLIVRDEVKLDKEVMSELVEKLCEILDGKGTLRGDLYQAKVSKVNSVNKAVKFAQDFFKEKS